MIKPFESQIYLLRTISGIDYASAITIISEIGTDMSQFTNVKRLCCWVELMTPGNNEATGKKKSVRIIHAGVYFKPAFVQVAHVAMKNLEQSYYKIKYECILKRYSKKRAIMAIARMILTAIYFIFKSGETFNPSDL